MEQCSLLIPLYTFEFIHYLKPLFNSNVLAIIKKVYEPTRELIIIVVELDIWLAHK